MSSSKYTKTMAEAYEEVYEMDLKRGLKGFTDAIVGAGKHGLKALQAGAGGIKGGAEAAEKARTGGGDKGPKKSGGETEAERKARRAAVGLEGNAGPDRAKASQEAAKPKIDAANQARKDNKAAGKTSSNLPSDYKKTEAQAFEKADKFRKGAGTSALPASVQREVKKAAAPTPKPTLNTPKLDTSKVGSGSSNFKAPTPTPAPRKTGSGFGRRPTGRAEMRSANIAKTNARRTSRPSTPKAPVSTPRLDAATSGVGKFTEAFETWYEQMTAGKSYGQPSGLDLRTTGQKMNQIKKSVQQNDKTMGKIQPPPGV
jgi:hypothetical protein